MKCFTRTNVLAVMISMVLPFAAQADNGAQHSNGILKVGLWGDEFYNDDAGDKSDQIAQTVASMNAHHLNFTLFAGDTKNGHSECTDAAITTEVEAVFNKLHAPTLYTLGDNEWTDCHRTSNGPYDPILRLGLLRSFFFAKDTTQGPHPIGVERQNVYLENSRFVRGNVEFIALHVPGSNNNLVASENQCIKKSTRTGWTPSVNGGYPTPDSDCADASDEFEARNTANIEWLEDSFDIAREQHLAGVLVLIQADIFADYLLSDGRYQEEFLPSLEEKDDDLGYNNNYVNGYRDFWNTMVDETTGDNAFDGQVLLVHGDSHYFSIDKPMFTAPEEGDPLEGHSIPNFTRVMVFGSGDNSWIEMTVDSHSENVFSFEPVVLK